VEHSKQFDSACKDAVRIGAINGRGSIRVIA
jgi:hypothetical protein